MRKCIPCGIETTGSIGAAGLHWTMICQPCKDREDAAALAQLSVLASALRREETESDLAEHLRWEADERADARLYGKED